MNGRLFNTSRDRGKREGRLNYRCNNENTFEDTIECLRRNFDGLGPECKSMIFYREKIEAVDNSMDDELQVLSFYPFESDIHREIANTT